MPCCRHPHHHLPGGSGGALFLIGLGVLFLTNAFWPWILAVIGVAALPANMARQGSWAGLQGAIWMIGLAFLFALDSLWPGVLILTGISMLFSTLGRPPTREKRKRKRGLPPDEQAIFAPDDMPERG